MQEPLPLLENTKLRRNGFHSPNEQEVEEQFELEKALKVRKQTVESILTKKRETLIDLRMSRIRHEAWSS